MPLVTVELSIVARAYRAIMDKVIISPQLFAFLKIRHAVDFFQFFLQNKQVGTIIHTFAHVRACFLTCIHKKGLQQYLHFHPVQK